MSGGYLCHAAVIDTINDEVLGDVGDRPISTVGVAVRPFWWSYEHVEVMGSAR